MKEWALEHPYLTTFIIISCFGFLSGVVENFSKKPEKASEPAPKPQRAEEDAGDPVVAGEMKSTKDLN